MNSIDDGRGEPLASRVLARIAHEGLTPRPRWEFRFRNYLFWALGALAVALGALAVSASLFEIASIDWRLSSATHGDFFSFFLAAAPFLWVFVVVLFIVIGYANVRRTAHGYRYPLALIAIGAVLASLALGSGLYALGVGGAVEEVIGDHPPFYRPILAEERSWWLAPEKGLLGGEVVSIASTNAAFVLRDFDGRLWEVSTSDLRTPDLAAVARGGRVRLVGLPAEALPMGATSSAFHACFVFPWEPRGRGDGEAPALPLATVASTSERSSAVGRSEECKGIRPYEQLQDIDD